MLLKRYYVECEDPYCALENIEKPDGEFVLWEDIHDVYDAAMAVLEAEEADVWSEAAYENLIEVCRRKKEGR